MYRFRPWSMMLVAALSSLQASAQVFGELTADCDHYTSIPLPPEADRVTTPAAFPNCGSYRFYAGVGRAKDYAKARQCAWLERAAQRAELRQNPEEPLSWVVGGSLILADLYINGAGVKRNVPLAMRLACEAEPNMVQIAVEEFQKLERVTRVEFCDYASSTFSMNFCAGYAQEIEEDRQRRYFNSRKKLMTREQKLAFERLLAAEDAYVDVHAQEVDQGGTIRVLRTIGSQSILLDLFRTQLVWFERGQWPKLETRAIEQADSQLETAYADTIRRLRGRNPEDQYDGMVSAQGVEQVQKVWEKYLDAWVSFARVRYPDSVNLIRAYVSLDRARLLKTIP